MVFDTIVKALIDLSTKLLISYSYAALFLIALIASSTIFLPTPFDFIVFLAPLPPIKLNPFLVGVVAGAGSTLGEYISYLFGVGSRALIEERLATKVFGRFTKLFKKYGFVTLILTAFIPFPFHAAGIMGGMSQYDLRKFFLAVLIGKIPKFLLIAYSGLYAIPLINVVGDWLIKSIF